MAVSQLIVLLLQLQIQQSNVATAGTLTVAGATTLNGAVTLGDNSSDAITINGTIQGLSNLEIFLQLVILI